MKLTKRQLKRIIREAMDTPNWVSPEDQGVGGSANALLDLYLRGELDEEELQYLREDMSPGDIDEIITIYERLIAILMPLTEG